MELSKAEVVTVLNMLRHIELYSSLTEEEGELLKKLVVVQDDKIKEGDKVHYRDSYGDIHTARISHLFTSARGNSCAALNDGATKPISALVVAK